MQNRTTLRDLALFIGFDLTVKADGLWTYIMDLWAKTKIWNKQVFHLIIIVQHFGMRL